MRVELNDQEGQILGVVLNNVMDTLRQLETEGKGQSVLQGLKGAEDLLARLRGQLPHLEMGVRETRFLQEILHVIRQNLGSSSVQESFLSSLEEKLATTALPLTLEQRMALTVILGTISTQLPSLGEDEKSKASIEKALRLLQDVRERLERLELTEREAAVLKSLVRSVRSSIQSEGQDSDRLLADLEGKLASNCRVTIEDRQALGIVLEQLIPALKVEFEKDTSEKKRAAVAVTELILLNTQPLLRSLVLSRLESKLLQSVLSLLASNMRSQLVTFKANLDAVLQLQALVELA